MLKRSTLTACLLFGLLQSVQAQPSDPVYMEGLARQALVGTLRPMLKDQAAVAKLRASLEKPPKHYLDEIERLVALNVLARLLPDSQLRERLKQSGKWVEDARWDTDQRGQAAVDLPRTLRFAREIEIADQMASLGAYRAAHSHAALAMSNAPFASREKSFAVAQQRRMGMELLLDSQAVGEVNASFLDAVLKIELPTAPLSQENCLSMNLDFVRAADRAGLPLSARQGYVRLDELASQAQGEFVPVFRFIVGSQLFRLDCERDPAAWEQARSRFDRLYTDLQRVKNMPPYWSARLCQSLLVWAELGAGSWFDQRLEELSQGQSSKAFEYLKDRVQLARVAEARRQGKLELAARTLASLEPRMADLKPEIPDWKEPDGKPVLCMEAGWVLQQFHSEKARQLRMKPETALQALLEYRLAQRYVSILRDEVDLLNEAAPLVREWEQHSFEAENRRALEGSFKMLHRLGVMQARAELGLFQADQGQPAEALKNLTAAAEHFEKYLVDLRPAEERRLELRQRLKAVYERLAELKLEQGDHQGAFLDLARNQQVQQSLTAPVLRSQDTHLQSQLDSVQLMKEKVAIQEAQESKSSELLAKTKSEFFTLVRELRSAGKNYGGMLAVQPVEFAQLQQQIPPDTLLVQYYPTPKTLYFFIVSSKGFKVRSLAVDKQKLFALVHDFRRLCREQGPLALRYQGWDWQSQGGQQMATCLEQLHRCLLGPLQEDLRGFKVLAIVPTENLLYLPFPALAEVKQGKPRFLVEDLAVVTLLRATDLARLDRAVSGTRLLALGNPDGSLQGAQKEVEELGRTFPQAEIAVQGQATLSKLLQGSQPAQWIHLATHAVLDQSQPNNSYLVVAGEGPARQLTVPQIFDLPLQKTRLVTLSACETDLGEREPGAAVSSLAEAFWVAGSPSLLASLWSVEDVSTSRLMVSFYQKLGKGNPLGESLRQAQMGLIQDPKTQHPFFWAPFVLIGNWK